MIPIKLGVSIALLLGFACQLASAQTGVTLEVDLINFQNPGRNLLIGTQRKAYSCYYATVDQDLNCVVFFTLVVTDLRGNTQILSGPIVWGSENPHQLDENGLFVFQNSTYWYGKTFSVELPTKPATMMLIVHNTGNLEGDKLYQGTALMDNFKLNISGSDANNAYREKRTGQVSSKNVLNFAYRITCDEKSNGANCDLEDCVSVTGGPTGNERFCRNQKTGDGYICNQGASNIYTLRMDENCTVCPPEFSGKYCAEFVKNGDKNSIVASAQKSLKTYKNATIVLGVFLGIMLLIFIATVIFLSASRKKEYTMVTGRSTAFQDARNEALRRENEYKQNAPDNSAEREWFQPPRRIPSNNGNSAPPSRTNSSPLGSNRTPSDQNAALNNMLDGSREHSNDTGAPGNPSYNPFGAPPNGAGTPTEGGIVNRSREVEV